MFLLDDTGVAELVKTLGSTPFEAEDEEVCFATKHLDTLNKVYFMFLMGQ